MKKYKNFSVAIYCPVNDLNNITDFNEFSKRLAWIEKHVKVSKVYLETYRSGMMIDSEQMEHIRDFFQSRGIETSGGITANGISDAEGGFTSLCYTNPDTFRLLTQVVEFTASLFDEIILDDFYFTNCRCPSCIEAKGDQTWASFRLDLMQKISKDWIIAPAKRVNPNVQVIIKYPNWYEHFQDSGYNLEAEPHIFDALYTGTETRNPMYTQQHLPKYLSYFNMRYLENVAPGCNLGGWFDPFESTYNLTSYAEQAYLTLFAKAKEVMMFSLGSLLNPEYSLCIPIAGQLFNDVDAYMGELGEPTGTACYLPFHSHGEDYLHNYIGMLGIPLEPWSVYPKDVSTIFLTKSAAMDKNILSKIQRSLMQGADVIVTSGFLEATTQLGFQKLLANVAVTNRKARINRYVYSDDGGISFSGCEESAKAIMIPQLEFHTNDSWELIAGLGEDNNFPILTKTLYGKGRLYILTIPEDYGDLYHYPRRILLPIREIFAEDMPVVLDSFSKVGFFAYDNDCFILHSFQPWYGEINVRLKKGYTAIKDLVSGRVIEAEQENKNMVVRLRLSPGINRVFKLIEG